MTETTSTIQYFTSSDQSFSSGWYFVENGVRQSAADTGSSLSEANKIILGAGTPTGDTAPVTGGGGNDVFVVQSDTPSLLVIEDLIGDNTLLFSTGVTILSVSSVEAFGAKQTIIRFDTGDGVTKSIQVKALNNISFEFEAGPVAGRGFSFDELEAYLNGATAFSEKGYSVNLAEDASSGDGVITIVADDVTTGDTLTYSISDGNADGVFAIDSNTGAITLVGAVDFETGPAEYVLTVQVSDGNGGTDTVLVTVTVTNVDEGDPVFTGDLTGAIQDVSEDPDAVLSITGIINNIVDPEGDAVPPGTISIADATASGTALSIKTGTYGTFTFFASPGLGGSAARGGTWTYNLDRDRPETLALKAGEEVTETFTLVYTLGDGTEYRTDITITITGADDPFTFSQPDGYIFTKAEDFAVDGVVGQVQALDYDADTQAVVSYVITAGNDDGFFEVNSDGQIILKKGLDFETIISANKSFILTVQASDGTNTEDVFVTIKVTDVEEGPAKIQITPSDADLDAYDVGTVLTASLVEEDPDGLVGEAQWRWFYLDTPFASIGTGTTYTVKEEDRGEFIGVARVYEDGKGGKGLGENEVREVFVSIVPRVAITFEENTEESDNTVAAQPDKASIVQTGDGSDIITDGSRNDLIIGGLGDDKIDLGSDPDGYDQDQVIYAIGDQTAEDGGDMITNFTRGRDSFIFKLSANAETNAILDMDDFINYLNGGTADDLSDDQLLVGLNFDLDSEGEIELNGLSFHFADSVFFGGGRVSIPVVTISFADPLDKAAIINVLGGDEATIPNIVNSDGILTDLSYLDDLLGGPDAVGYQVEVV
ncbi:MAG: cadherin domain-containing protein [Proteobacteria bacterium]|nr:cadherin domain-containing protein [Pseudomonadota bacterium]